MNYSKSASSIGPMKSPTSWSTHPFPLLSDEQVRWLFAPGSLTSRLKALGDYSLELVDQRQCQAIGADAQPLDVSVGTPIWMREVLMRINKQPCVAARSITLANALKDDWIELAGYGSDPLGDILYSDPAVIRSPFECARLAPGDPLEVLSRRFDTKANELKARRSCFVRNGSRLLVSECFLSEFWYSYSG